MPVPVGPSWTQSRLDRERDRGLDAPPTTSACPRGDVSMCAPGNAAGTAAPLPINQPSTDENANGNPTGSPIQMTGFSPENESSQGQNLGHNQTQSQSQGSRDEGYSGRGDGHSGREGHSGRGLVRAHTASYTLPPHAKYTGWGDPKYIPPSYPRYGGLNPNHHYTRGGGAYGRYSGRDSNYLDCDWTDPKSLETALRRVCSEVDAQSDLHLCGSRKTQFNADSSDVNFYWQVRSVTVTRSGTVT